MPEITTLAGLQAAIRELETGQAGGQVQFKEQLLAGFERLTFINVLKRILQCRLPGPGRTVTVADAAIGLATGFLAKKAVMITTNHRFKQVAGLVLEMTVAHRVAGRAGLIKKIGGLLLNRILPDQPGSRNT